MGSELYVSQTIYINISQLIVEICPVSRAAVGKLWPVLQIQVALCFGQSCFTGARSLVNIFSAAAFALQWQNRVLMTETT